MDLHDACENGNEELVLFLVLIFQIDPFYLFAQVYKTLLRCSGGSSFEPDEASRTPLHAASLSVETAV